MKKTTYIAILAIALFSCQNDPVQLPDPNTLFPEPEQKVRIINGDTIPLEYSKTIDDLQRLLTVTDNIDLLTIQGASGSREWKKFYVSVLKAYIMDELNSLGDVTITSPSSGQVLTYNGSAWVNGAVAGSGDVTTAQLADSTAAVRADFPTPLTEEQVEDFIGGMVTGNSETLISVTYDDGGGVLNFVVESNLSNYTNDAGFLTSEVDGSTTNEIQTLSFSSPNISISDGNTIDISAIDTQLSNEQVQDIIGAMLSANTETLITVTYDDSTGKINFVVDEAGLRITESQIDDLEHTAANTVSGSYDYITLSGQDIVRGQIDLSTDVTGSANGITATNPTGGTNTLTAALTDLNNLITANTLLIQNVTPATATMITVNQNSRTNCISVIDMTTASAVSTITLSMSNTAAGVITLSFENTTNGMEIDFPSTFLDQTGAAWDGASTYSVTADFFMTCYSSDGTNWKCK